jgi:hypothetical protein
VIRSRGVDEELLEIDGAAVDAVGVTGVTGVELWLSGTGVGVVGLLQFIPNHAAIVWEYWQIHALAAGPSRTVTSRLADFL